MRNWGRRTSTDSACEVIDTSQLHVPHKRRLLDLCELMVKSAVQAKPTIDKPTEQFRNARQPEITRLADSDLSHQPRNLIRAREADATFLVIWGFRVLLGMLERERFTRTLFSVTKRCSDGLHRTPTKPTKVERPADVQFRPFIGRADLFETGCSMSKQGWPCPCHRWHREFSLILLARWASYF